MYLQRDQNRQQSSFEVCYQGMNKLFNNAPDEDYFSKSVLKDVKDVDFQIDSVGLIKILNNYECDVVVKDSKGHRSCRVKLEKNFKFPHLYRISDVRGQKLVSDYQWKGSL
jgi:hypothetical protein